MAASPQTTPTVKTGPAAIATTNRKRAPTPPPLVTDPQQYQTFGITFADYNPENPDHREKIFFGSDRDKITAYSSLMRDLVKQAVSGKRNFVAVPGISSDIIDIVARVVLNGYIDLRAAACTYSQLKLLLSFAHRHKDDNLAMHCIERLCDLVKDDPEASFVQQVFEDLNDPEYAAVRAYVHASMPQLAQAFVSRQHAELRAVVTMVLWNEDFIVEVLKILQRDGASLYAIWWILFCHVWEGVDHKAIIARARFNPLVTDVQSFTEFTYQFKPAVTGHTVFGNYLRLLIMATLPPTSMRMAPMTRPRIMMLTGPFAIQQLPEGDGPTGI